MRTLAEREATRAKQRVSGKLVSRLWPDHWSMAAAVRQAEQMLAACGGGRILEPDDQRLAPVEQARVIAERFARADMLLSVLVSHGTPVDDLERARVAFGRMTDLAHKRLAILGLKAGETQELDMSDRMQDFLARFFGRGGRAPALPPVSVGGPEPPDQPPTTSNGDT